MDGSSHRFSEVQKRSWQAPNSARSILGQALNGAERRENKMTEFSVPEALEAKAPSLAENCRRDTHILDQTCPECGGRVACVCDQYSSVDLHDECAHVCLNPGCRYVEVKGQTLCGSNNNEQLGSVCLICGRRSLPGL